MSVVQQLPIAGGGCRQFAYAINQFNQFFLQPIRNQYLLTNSPIWIAELYCEEELP